MRTICFTLCIATSAFSLADEVRSSEQPNIVLILADDLGYSDLGCYGGEIRTPNIDALAAGGVRFTQLYNSTRCCPSRASLMTGLYPSQAGIGDFTTPRPSPTRGPGYLGRLNEQCVTLAEVLEPAGYGCYYVGKWHMHPETGPIRRGFDEFYGYTNDHSHDQYDAEYYIRLPEGRTKEIDPPQGEFYATDVFNQYALEFIRQAQQTDKPWFLFLGHSSPHFPVQAPAERADKYEETYQRGWDVLREERFARMQKLGLIDGARWKLTRRSIVPVDRDDIANGFSGQPNPAWESLGEDRRYDLARRMAVFAAMVERVDQGVGQIVEHLKETGDFDNTLILFLSDNGACYEWGPFGFDGVSRRGTTTLHTGEDLRKIGGPGTHHSYGSAWANLGNTPFRLYKHFTHEGGISTPFIAHWPRGVGKQDQWIRDPAHVMDIMPTILDAAGANYPATHNGNAITPMEGTSLLPRMRGDELPDRTIGFDHQAAHALRRGDWKIVWSKRMPHEIQWELYNLAEDRCETNDLAEMYPDRVREMAAEWEQWARHVGVIYESADDPPESDSPLIANRPLTISGHVKSEKGVGVIVAQGGREHGFAVHLIQGKLAFDVRVYGKVTRLVTDEAAPKEFDFQARLTAKSMTLAIDGAEVAQGASPGLIPIQPKDAMSIGRDILTAAGDYVSPNPLQGTVSDLKVIPEKGVGSLLRETCPSDTLQKRLPTPFSVMPGRKKFGSVTKPIFADPNYHGSCDPEIVWNPTKQEWFVYYTARRATREQATYVGTPLGVISSPDLVNWRFRGYCSFDGKKGMPDNEDTHWAPGIIAARDHLHMFATYKASAEPPWGGDGVIRHYKAPLDDPIDGWKLAGVPEFHQPDPIDVSLLQIDGEFRAYYRVGRGGGIQWASSPDLSQWTNHGKCLGDVNASPEVRGFGYQEAPYVFQWQGRYWMLTDPHEGLAVFHSPDGITWTQQQRILREPGEGEADATLARHPSVAVLDDRAFVFYHTEPNRPYPTPPPAQRTPHQKISFLQMAELEIENGQLVCDRNAEITLAGP